MNHMLFRETINRRTLHLLMVGVMLSFTSCMHFTTHQGNVLKPEVVGNVRVDDSRFHVESVLGSPVLKDKLHPNRSIYVEDFRDAESDKQYQRRVEIIYSEAGRVKAIKRFGFEKKSE